MRRRVAVISTALHCLAISSQISMWLGTCLAPGGSVCWAGHHQAFQTGGTQRLRHVLPQLRRALRRALEQPLRQL